MCTTPAQDASTAHCQGEAAESQAAESQAAAGEAAERQAAADEVSMDGMGTMCMDDMDTATYQLKDGEEDGLAARVLHT